MIKLVDINKRCYKEILKDTEGIIYKITNLVNGKKYIGKRSCKCPIEDDKYMGSGYALKKAFDKSYLLKVNNKYMGLFRVCKSKDINYQDIGELQALYLLNEVKHMGYGRILFEKACDEVKKMGFNSMIVGCLSDNTNANSFYKHIGGVLVSSRDFTLPNQTLNENVYLFREI